jgi:hypothetical protein
VTAKSVIDVDINDVDFQRFSQLFDKYSETLRKQPDLWKKVNAEHQKLAQGFATLGNQWEKHSNALADIESAQSDQEKHLTLAGRLWGGMERSTKGVAQNITSATTTLLKWSGLLSGLSLFGGMWGLERLSASAASQTTTAMGLGLTQGQQRSFGINFQSLLGSPEGVLSGINQAVTDISKQWPLYTLGVNPNGSTADVAINTMQAVRRLALATPTNQLGILESTRGLSNLGFGVEDLRRFKTMSDPDFNYWISGFQRDQRGLNFNGEAWQRLTTSIDRAKASIETTFITALAPLAPQFTMLTSEFQDLVKTELRKGGPIDTGLHGLNDWLKEFTSKQGQAEFHRNVQELETDLGAVASFFHTLAGVGRAWGWWQQNGPEHYADKAGGWLWDKAVGAGAWVGTNWSRWCGGNSFNQNESLRYFQEAAALNPLFGLPAGTLETLGQIESGMNPNIRDSSAGAVGMYQFMSGVAGAMGFNPRDPEASIRGAGTLMAQLIKQFGDYTEAVAAWNSRPDTVRAALAKAGKTGGSWEDYLPQETKNFLVKAANAGLPVVITIHDSTGASIHVAASQLGPSS